VWGDIGYITGVWYNPDKQCFIMDDLVKPNLFTSNPGGIPDSLKIWIFREQRCISWNVTTGCSPTDGHYTDNLTLRIPPPKAGVSDKISIDIWDWYGDAFPANETPGLPGTAAFDTYGALIQTARNQAPATGNDLRFDVPGDSILVKTTSAGGTPRLDMVFRIFPGPGNYAIAGNMSSGLKKMWDYNTKLYSTAVATSGDNSFWGQYMANNGPFGTPGGHAGNGTVGSGWNVNVWNSARCDTVEINLFPVEGKTANLPAISLDQYMTTLHEQDGHFGVLGIPKNICFIVDTLGSTPNNSTNITCSYIPAWVTTRPGTGYDVTTLGKTKEYTKIIPDGLLTAGSSVQYFFRMSRSEDGNVAFVADPDTCKIAPQVIGSASNFDSKRWETVSILPDRWKDALYSGLGSACILVADYNDRRGDERVWVGAMDSIGATGVVKYGAHNGWHCTAAYVSGDGSHNYNNDNICTIGGGSQFANIAVSRHGSYQTAPYGGQAGTAWDLYNIHAAESSNTGSGQLGDRLANRADAGYIDGKFSKHGPTPEMLRTYYKVLFIMSGDLNTSFFGKDVDRGQDDIALVNDFLTYNANYLNPRGVWAEGHGFAESMDGYDAAHTDFLNNVFAASLRDPSDYALSGSVDPCLDLIMIAPPHCAPACIYGIGNSCLYTNDVLDVNGGITSAQVAAYYENVGSNGPYIASVYAPSTVGAHPFKSLLDGWDMWNQHTRGGYNTVGRLQYFMDVLTCVFGSICPFTPAPTVDVAQNTTPAIDFMGNVWGNPMVSGGKATIHFGLARSDRVQVRVYDVTGRLVRTLADRNFQAGEQKLTWDGTNDQGQMVARGVYFTQVKFVNSRFEDAKKLTILK